MLTHHLNAAGLWADETYNMLGDEVSFELGKGVLFVFDRSVTRRFISPLYLKPDPVFLSISLVCLLCLLFLEEALNPC
ncbi:MAG: hypothetical protein ACP5IE_04235 [Infirmifilum sp.]